MKAASIGGVVVALKKDKVAYSVPQGMRGKDFAIWQIEYSTEIHKFISMTAKFGCSG